jgi:hypothetical protein
VFLADRITYMARLHLAEVMVYLTLVTIHEGMATTKTLTAVRTGTPPVIDGAVTDSVWQTAPAALDFTQFGPVEGAMPTELTSVRILYDNSALYVGVICYDAQPGRIVRQLTRRDRNSEADRFSVMIDSYFDRHTAFVFVTNVSGVKSDGVLSQDGAVYDITWDAVWTVMTRVYRDGWSAEFKIPYNALRFAVPRNGEQQWGINFRRYISRKKETDEWVMVPRSEMSQIPKWGILEGIRDVQPPLHLELLPYASGRATYQTATANRGATTATGAEAGLDIKYGIAHNFTLDATINPDFGQVEVDQSVLNLTVFETHFPEKRPFFVEGAQMFTFGSSVDNTPLSLFFSRRVGRQPLGSSTLQAPIGWTIDNNPQVTTILGAGKVTGRTNSGFSLGLMSAATDEINARLISVTGRDSSVRTEPRGSYSVARFKQDFEGGSWLGGLGTLALRQNLDPAVSGGLDWNIRFGSGTHTIDGYAAWARSSTFRQNSDGSLAPSRDGGAGRLLVSRISAEHWFYTGSVSFFTRNFNPNDLGFFAQPRDYGGYVQLLYRENAAAGFLRRYAVSVVPEVRWNWDGILTLSQSELTVTGELKNFWTATMIYDAYFPAYDDEERGIIGIHRRPAGHNFVGQITSDERKSVTATITGSYAIDTRRKASWTASIGLSIRPVSWVELNPTAAWIRTRREDAWITGVNVTDTSASPKPFSVFADRALDELDLELSGTVTFTRTLSLQFFTQVLLARARYLNHRRIVDGVEVPYLSTAVGGDFNEALLNANVLLRWEYLPGSTLYLVWTQERFDYQGMYGSDFSTRFRETFALPHEDVLFLKLSYWLPL